MAGVVDAYVVLLVRCWHGAGAVVGRAMCGFLAVSRVLS